MILFIIIIAIAIFVIVFYNSYTCEHFSPDRKTFISLTTIPARLEKETFIENIKYLLSLTTNETIILNVPYVSRKNVKYVIPDKLLKLCSDKFIIHRTPNDEGPITKLLPSLRNPLIKNDDIIIVIDDDVFYKKNIFRILKKIVLKHPDHVASFCIKKVKGFQGFGFVKSLLIGMLNLKIPEVCIKIDDYIIQYYIRENNIKTYKTYYHSGKYLRCFDKLVQNITGNPYCAEIRNKSISLLNSYDSISLVKTTDRTTTNKLCEIAFSQNHS